MNMLKPRILICIAFYYREDRILYLEQLLDNYSAYNAEIDIIIDCNSAINLNAKICVHNLEHPHYLTWVHRKHFADNIDKYDYFMYVEDDMLLKYEAFYEYICNFDALWQLGYVPSFVRLEYYNGKIFVNDVTIQQTLNPIIINGKQFTNLSQPYHAFWIMPHKQLKESMNKNFIRFETSRELAASYPMWELKKTPLVRIENNEISELSYSYHLPNNYACDPNKKLAKIEIQNIFKT